MKKLTSRFLKIFNIPRFVRACIAKIYIHTKIFERNMCDLYIAQDKEDDETLWYETLSSIENELNEMVAGHIPTLEEDDIKIRLSTSD